MTSHHLLGDGSPHFALYFSRSLDGSEAAKLFYAVLFTIAAELRSMFPVARCAQWTSCSRRSDTLCPM